MFHSKFTRVKKLKYFFCFHCFLSEAVGPHIANDVVKMKEIKASKGRPVK